MLTTGYGWLPSCGKPLGSQVSSRPGATNSSRIEHEEKEHPSLVDGNWDWNNVRNLGLFTYLLSKRGDRNTKLVDELQ